LGWLVGDGGDFGEGGFDVSVGDAAGAEFARDALGALTADASAMRGELAGVDGVVEIAAFAEKSEDDVRGFGIGGALLEIFAHLGDGVGSAHQGAHGGGIERFVGIVFAGTAAHCGRSIGARGGRSKEQQRQRRRKKITQRRRERRGAQRKPEDKDERRCNTEDTEGTEKDGAERRRKKIKEQDGG